MEVYGCSCPIVVCVCVCLLCNRKARKRSSCWCRPPNPWLRPSTCVCNTLYPPPSWLVPLSTCWSVMANLTLQWQVNILPCFRYTALTALGHLHILYFTANYVASVEFIKSYAKHISFACALTDHLCLLKMLFLKINSTFIHPSASFPELLHCCWDG